MKKIEKELRRKQEQEELKLKENKGITLIALVITKKYSSTHESMKSVAYMLDIKAWDKFAVTGKADYAIGGPTLELLFKSYNQKYETNYVAEAADIAGYKVGSGTALEYDLKLSNTGDPLYVITSNSNAVAYWLASPANTNTANVFCVNSNRSCVR